MKTLLPYLISFITIYSMFLIGNKNILGWWIGIANQVLWLVFILWYKSYGLLPLTILIVVVYTRNLITWRSSP